MWKWMRRTWGERQAGAISDLAYATGEIVPDWQQIQIDRKGDGDLVLSVTGPTSTTVSKLSKE